MRDLAAYAAAVTVGGALRVFSDSAARRLGESLAGLAYRPFGVRREVVESQVAAAFPDRPPEWVRETARACYAHFGREAAATLRLGRAGRKAVLARTEGAGELPGRFRELSPKGAALIVTGHLGNWELAGTVLGGVGLPVSAVVRRQSGPFDRRLTKLREDLGIRTISEEEAPRGVRRALRSGRVVALVADQHAGPRGIRVSFLGRPASTFRGPARLALGCGVPLLFGALLREGDRYRIVLEPVQAPSEGASRRERELRLTRGWVERLEACVRARPEQYFWFHRRWKAARNPSGGQRSVGTAGAPAL